jgi:hypothetical protein
MLHKKPKSGLCNATLRSVTEELAKPRTTKSARIAELNLDTARIPEQPSITVPGTVDKIIPSSRSSQPEKAQIAIEGSNDQRRDLRIDSALRTNMATTSASKRETMSASPSHPKNAASNDDVKHKSDAECDKECATHVGPKHQRTSGDIRSKAPLGRLPYG